ncbi:MAG TPA: STAS domain-containing protein [Rhodanobacter sp.]
MTGKRLVKKKGAKPASTPVPGGDPGVVQLPPDCRISAQNALKAELVAVLDAGAIAVLDGSQVERVDTAALQMLVIFQRELEARGASVSWRGANSVLNEAAGLLGLAQILKLPADGLA